MIKEACIENYFEGILAEKKGATRLELCENLSVGGTTPSFGSVFKLSKDTHIPLRVMIRPRGGNFCYSDDEFEIMKIDIVNLKKFNIEGFVFGILNKDNTIDRIRVRELIELSRPLKVTFHKAVDETPDIMVALDELLELGVDSVLTSGGSNSTALEGASTLNSMVEHSKGRIEIIAAGQITTENFDLVKSSIKGISYHGKKIV